MRGGVVATTAKYEVASEESREEGVVFWLYFCRRKGGGEKGLGDAAGVQVVEEVEGGFVDGHEGGEVEGVLFCSSEDRGEFLAKGAVAEEDSHTRES